MVNGSKMATDDLRAKLRRIIFEFENEANKIDRSENDYNYITCTVPSIAACPVVIKFCDASAKSKSFSEATVDFCVQSGFPLAVFFEIGQTELTSYLLGKTVNKSEAIKRLEDFISNGTM